MLRHQSNLDRKKSNISRTNTDENESDKGENMQVNHGSSSSSSDLERTPLLMTPLDHPEEESSQMARNKCLLFDAKQAEKLAKALAYCPTTLFSIAIVVGVISAINSIVTYSIPLDKNYIFPPWTSTNSFNPQNSCVEMAIFDIFRSFIVLGLFWTRRFNFAFYAACLAVVCCIGKLWVFRNYSPSSSLGDIVVLFVVLAASIAQCVLMYLGARFTTTEGINTAVLWKLLRPFFLPKSWKDRFIVIMMWSILTAAQFCVLYAPLQLAHIVQMISNPKDNSGGLESNFRPRQTQDVGNETTSTSESPTSDNGFYINSHEPAGAITIYVVLRLLPKILNEIRDLLYCQIWKSAHDEISTTLFHHIHSLPYDFHLNKQLGALVQSVSNGIDAADGLVHKMFILLVPSLVATCAAFFIFALHLNVPLIAGIAFLGTSTYVWATIVMTTLRETERDEFSETVASVRSVFTDSLVNFETIKVFGKELYFGEKYREAVNDMTSSYLVARSSHSSIDFVQSTLSSLTRYGCLLIAGLALSENWVGKGFVDGQPTMMSVAKFVAINEYLSSIFEPLEKLTSVFMDIINALIELKHIVHLYSLPTDETDDKASEAFDLTQVKQSQRVCKTLHFKKIDPVTGKEVVTEEEVCLYHARGLEVEFRNVCFTYPGASHRSLDNVSFKVPACTSCGICGSSGGGKSSICKLLLRFYEPDSGEIFIAGRNIKTITKSSIREVIGTVSQNATLIDDSFANNILFGHPHAKREDAEALVKQVQLSGVVDSLPEGCLTRVGKGKLSGGEIQRIALARALLKDPLVFLADEHTASLDLNTEREIINATESFIEGEGRTSIYITHRLHTIVHVDQILVIDHGKIVDQGTHQELIAKEDGMYHQMWMHQLGDDAAHHHHHHHHQEDNNKEEEKEQ